MDSITGLIPKDKFDTSKIESLSTIRIEAAEPILGALLEWMQDINWPAAQSLMDVLPRFHLGLVPHIQAVFRSNDDIWKCWVLLLLKKFPSETVAMLSEDIKRIALLPTQAEVSEEADAYAQEVMVMFGL